LRPIGWRWPGVQQRGGRTSALPKVICQGDLSPRRFAPVGHADRATSDDDGRNTCRVSPKPRRIQTQPKVAGKENLAGTSVARDSRALLSPSRALYLDHQHVQALDLRRVDAAGGSLPAWRRETEE